MRKGFNRRKSERGQAFVELALSMVFLLTLLSAVVDLGWAFYTLIALRDMAQEGAAYGSLYPCEVSLLARDLKSTRQLRIVLWIAPRRRLHQMTRNCSGMCYQD